MVVVVEEHTSGMISSYSWRSKAYCFSGTPFAELTQGSVYYICFRLSTRLPFGTIELERRITHSPALAENEISVGLMSSLGSPWISGALIVK